MGFVKKIKKTADKMIKSKYTNAFIISTVSQLEKNGKKMSVKELEVYFKAIDIDISSKEISNILDMK